MAEMRDNLVVHPDAWNELVTGEKPEPLQLLHMTPQGWIELKRRTRV